MRGAAGTYVGGMRAMHQKVYKRSLPNVARSAIYIPRVSHLNGPKMDDSAQKYRSSRCQKQPAEENSLYTDAGHSMRDDNSAP